MLAYCYGGSTNSYFNHLKEFCDWVHKHANILSLFLGQYCTGEQAIQSQLNKYDYRGCFQQLVEPGCHVPSGYGNSSDVSSFPAKVFMTKDLFP